MGILWKTEQMYKVLLVPSFSGGTIPTFLQHIGNMVYCLPFDKVWLSSVADLLHAKPGNEVESRIHGGWVKTPVLFLIHPFGDQSSRNFQIM